MKKPVNIIAIQPSSQFEKLPQLRHFHLGVFEQRSKLMHERIGNSTAQVNKTSRALSISIPKTIQFPHFTPSHRKNLSRQPKKSAHAKPSAQAHPR
jgi:hypothetical protein